VDAQGQKLGATTTSQTASFALSTSSNNWVMYVVELKPR
jgi:hypothetical protein